MYQFYSRTGKCELISETRKALTALSYCYSLIILNGSPSKISLKCLLLIQSHHKMKSSKSGIYNNPFEIIRTRWNSSPCQSNQNHNGKTSNEIQRSSRYTVHTIDIFSLVVTTTASTSRLVENFQLICCSQRVNATCQYDDSDSQVFKMAERSDGCSGETLLAPCARKKGLQRKMTERLQLSRC